MDAHAAGTSPKVHAIADARGRLLGILLSGGEVHAFAEPDRNTSKPVVFRWFQRADGLPFFFAGIWREWEGDRGTKAKPNAGKQSLYSFLTTSPNGIVEPIHNKAMPMMLTTEADVDRWLDGTPEEALELQRPAPDEAVVMLPLETKAA